MRVLFISVSGIGDSVMAIPAIKALSLSNQHVIIDIMVGSRAAEFVMQKVREVNQVFYLPLNLSPLSCRLIWQLLRRRRYYDFSINTMPSYRLHYNILAFLVGAKHRIVPAHASGKYREFRILNNLPVEVLEEVHNADNNLQFLRALGVERPLGLKNNIDVHARIVLNQDLKERSRKRLEAKFKSRGVNTIVAIHPGSTLSPVGLAKRWPIEKYIDLVNLIGKKTKSGFIFFLGDDEKDLYWHITRSTIPKDTYIVLQNLSFEESLVYLSESDMLISNDNGFAHCAPMLGVRTFVLFGPTSYKLSAPYNELAIPIIPASYIPWHRFSQKRKSINTDASENFKDVTPNYVFDNFLSPYLCQL